MARPDKITSALLDASALIGFIKGEPDFACLQSLLAGVDRGAITLVESTAMLAEVQPAHDGDTVLNEETRAKVRALLESPGTTLVDVSTAVARKAGDLRVKHRMLTWDAVHLATAIVAKVDVLVVRDHAFPEGDCEGVYVTGPFDVNEGTILGLL